MSSATATKPKKGETYTCQKCGMEMKVTADCKGGSGPTMTCCGEPLKKA